MVLTSREVGFLICYFCTNSLKNSTLQENWRNVAQEISKRGKINNKLNDSCIYSVGEHIFQELIHIVTQIYISMNSSNPQA